MADSTVSNNYNQHEQALQIQQEIPAVLHSIISLEQWQKLTYEQKALLKNIEGGLPQQLVGAVPESVWATLSVENRMQFLFTNNLIPKNEILANPLESAVENGFDGAMQGTESLDQAMSAEVQTGGGIEVQINPGQKEQEDFQHAVEQVNSIEQQFTQENGDVLAKDDSLQKQLEHGSNLMPNMPKFVGHQPSNSTVTNYSVQARSGSTDDGRTWISSMIQKFVDSISLDRAE